MLKSPTKEQQKSINAHPSHSNSNSNSSTGSYHYEPGYDVEMRASQQHLLSPPSLGRPSQRLPHSLSERAKLGSYTTRPKPVNFTSVGPTRGYLEKSSSACSQPPLGLARPGLSNHLSIYHPRENFPATPSFGTGLSRNFFVARQSFVLSWGTTESSLDRQSSQARQSLQTVRVRQSSQDSPIYSHEKRLDRDELEGGGAE